MAFERKVFLGGCSVVVRPIRLPDFPVATQLYSTLQGWLQGRDPQVA